MQEFHHFDRMISRCIEKVQAFLRLLDADGVLVGPVLQY